MYKVYCTYPTSDNYAGVCFIGADSVEAANEFIKRRNRSSKIKLEMTNEQRCDDRLRSKIQGELHTIIYEVEL